MGVYSAGQGRLSRKLAHQWHGPFRIIEKGENVRYKLKLAGTGYRFHPWVHVSRLKGRREHPCKPTERPEEVAEDADLDAALLPEDSWDADESQGVYEVEKILDVRWQKETRTSKSIKHYLVRWKGYRDPSWVPYHQLNCGRLLWEFNQTAKAKARFDAMQVGDHE